MSVARISSDPSTKAARDVRRTGTSVIWITLAPDTRLPVSNGVMLATLAAISRRVIPASSTSIDPDVVTVTPHWHLDQQRFANECERLADALRFDAVIDGQTFPVCGRVIGLHSDFQPCSFPAGARLGSFASGWRSASCRTA